MRAHLCSSDPQFPVHDNLSPPSSHLTSLHQTKNKLSSAVSFPIQTAVLVFNKPKPTATANLPLSQYSLSSLSNSMETNADFRPNAHPNERVDELDLSNSASIAFVCALAFLCLLLVLAYYCHCYCSSEARTGACCLFRKWKPASPLPLPVVSYNKADEELTWGCVVCLCEFEDKEAVKVIPGCGHVFHPQCIDRWLVSHVSCPVCRCSKIFGSGDHREKEAEEEEVVEEQVLIRMERSWSWCYRVDDHEEEERTGMRRTCSF